MAHLEVKTSTRKWLNILKAEWDNRSIDDTLNEMRKRLANNDTYLKRFFGSIK